MRSELSRAEGLLFRAIGAIRGGDESGATPLLLRAREQFDRLRARAGGDAALRLALERRLQARIARILDALERRPGIEFFDLLAADGSRTGQRIPSTLAHLTGARHASVETMFHRGADETLLQLRAPNVAIFPSRWTFTATGHAASGVSPAAAALEEISEEVSVPVLPSEIETLPALAREWLERGEPETWLRFRARPEALARIGAENAHDGCLYLYEFIYLDDAELAAMEDLCEDAARNFSGPKLAGIHSAAHAESRTLFLFTFSPARRAGLDAAAEEIESRLGVARGVLADNVEKKNLYCYRPHEEESRVLDSILALKKNGSRPTGDGFASDFKWTGLGEIVRNLAEHPERYTDAFLPYLADPAILPEIQAELARGGGRA